MRPPTIPTAININRDDSKQVVMMKSLYNSLVEYREPKTHRILIQVFMCLPSRKDFPEYFNIIEKPIAMNKIRERIERQLYADEEACMLDFKLMFYNCKTFNEDDSQIYKDATHLENLLSKKKEQLQLEYSRTSRDSKEAILNTTPNNNSTTSNTTNSSSPTIRSERLNNQSSTTNNHATSNAEANKTSATNNSTNNNQQSIATDKPAQDNTSSPKIASNLKSSTRPNSINNTSANHNATSNNHAASTPDNNKTVPSTPKTATAAVAININGIASSNGVSASNRDTNTQQSDSTNHSTTDHTNGTDELDIRSIKVNHNHHNETSMDSSSNLSADLLASTPVEKCSLNTRRGRNSDAPKRQLLTGYIIYASEIRKQVIDKNPNQNFGDISRLVGNEWKALPHDIRSKYDQRALIHNKRVRERAQRELSSADGRLSTNGLLHTPKMTKRKLAKLAKEQMRQHHLSIAGHDDSTTQSPKLNHEHSSNTVPQAPSSTFKHHQHSQPQSTPQQTSTKVTTVESFTQTTAIRFVEPPTKKRLVHSESFKRYIETLQVPNRDLLAEETTPDRPPELPTHWLGAGVGRHESPEAALWALRDFMLQDAVTMRRSMEPYL